MSTELKFQAQCYQHFHNNYRKYRGHLRRIKNELDNHPYKTAQQRMKQLAENKATGVIPGDSDFYFIGERNTYIELKVDAQQSPAQKEFQQLVERCGHSYYIVRTLEQFDKLIKQIIHELPIHI